MSGDPKNDARLRREDKTRQVFFREHSVPLMPPPPPPPLPLFSLSSAPLRNQPGFGSPASSTSYAGGAAPYGSDSLGWRQPRARLEWPAVGRGVFGGAIKALFFLAALYGAYDGVSNQSLPRESFRKAGWTAYGLSDALGNKIKSIAPDSFLIAITNDFRWVIGLGVSIDVGLGAGAGNAVVWVVRRGAELIQSRQSASSDAAPAEFPIKKAVGRTVAAAPMLANAASTGTVPDEDSVRQAVAVFYETELRGTGMLNSGCSIAREPGCTVQTPGIAKTVYISTFKLLGCGLGQDGRLVCRFTVAFHCGLKALNSSSPETLSNPFVQALYCADFGSGTPSIGQAYLGPVIN